MRLRKANRLEKLGLALGVGLLLCPAGAFAQEQQIFQDDRALMRTDQQEVQQYQQAEQQYQQSAASRDESAMPYRLYAEKRIQALTKLKAAGGSPTKSLASSSKELYALQAWMKKDDATRAAERAHIKQLDQAIANLQGDEQAAMANLPADVSAMRETAQRQADDDKFNHMMQMNYFNELQSEMGAASWGRPPTDGTFNSVGGYGFQGGYGYGFGSGRRNVGF